MIKINFHDGAVHVVQAHYEIWSRYFSHIVYYAPFRPGQVALLEKDYNIEVCDDDAGRYSPYVVLGDVYKNEKYQNFKGYICMHDDLIINPKLFQILDLNKIWITRISDSKSTSWSGWTRKPTGGLKSMEKLTNDQRFNIFA
eukprot:UN33527